MITASSLFQSRYRAASHFRARPPSSNVATSLSVSISLSSGFSFQANFWVFFQYALDGFNLVIERLLISGDGGFLKDCPSDLVSISLSSGFSFQVIAPRVCNSVTIFSFNLVIERLLISGTKRAIRTIRFIMFQSRYRAASHFRLILMRGQMSSALLRFQSRYRAASHFRLCPG